MHQRLPRFSSSVGEGCAFTVTYFDTCKSKNFSYKRLRTEIFLPTQAPPCHTYDLNGALNATYLLGDFFF